MKNRKNYVLGTSIILIIIFLGLTSIYKVNNISKDSSKIYLNSVHELLIDRIKNAEIVSLDNCDYKYSEDSGNLILRDYTGYADSVIIPESLNGKIVESIESNMFEYDNNLELIRVPKKISEYIDKIDNFQINEELSDEEYIVYVTNKTYNKDYFKYIGLSDSEKSEYEVIPPKFIVTLDEYIQNNQKKSEANHLLKSHSASIPQTYDQRQHITITKKAQGSYGICYACTSIEAVEMNLALKLDKEERLSEIHLAMVSEQFAGGLFVLDNNPYYSLGYGPVKYSDWNSSNVAANKDTDPIFATIDKLCKDDDDPSVTEEDKIATITKMKESVPDYYVLKTESDFPTIDGDIKQGNEYSNYESAINEARNTLKQYIMDNGAVISGVYIISGDSSQVRKNSDGVTCMYTKNKDKSANHEMALIGWDDNFPASSFPVGMVPKHDGAWLALNSWGSIFGDSGYCWISYDDYYAESWLRGVTSVHEGKVDLSECNISLSSDNFTYNGIEKRPDVSFKYEGNTYINGIDYTIEYRNNINPGQATAVITGINRFTGTIEKSFNIEQETPINTTKIGDLNKNDIIDVGDTLILYRHIAQSNNSQVKATHPDWEVSDEDLVIGDINKNGSIDVGDILKIQRYISANNNEQVAVNHPDWLDI